MEWAKSLMINSCDVLLVDRIDKKFDELDLYEQGGVTYIKIALDEMFTISNTVVATLQRFFEAFAKDGIAKVPNEDICAATEQIIAVTDRLKYLRSQVKVPVIFLKGSLGALLSFSGRLLHICWLLSGCNSFVI
jgi:hypothetical protein